MEKLLIIDGNNLLFQMFYGIPTKIYNKERETIHATIGFISAIQRIVKENAITKIIVVFDKDPAFDKIDSYNDYKANRTNDWENLPSDEVPFNEEEKIKRVLDYLNIKYFDSINMEADDLISSIVYEYQNDHEIIISSFDSDFFQLINNNVKVLRYRGKNTKIYDYKIFIDEFKFEPNKYSFYKALVGDTADNIKGVQGIGKVRATNIVNLYNNKEELFFDSFNKLNDNIKKLLVNQEELIKLNEQIIKLEVKEKFNKNITEFDFSDEVISKTNSYILSKCNIF